MKSRKECYQALLDGKTLKGKVGVYAKIDSGALIQSSDLKIWVQSTLLFKHPGDWSIYEEPPKPKYEVLYKCLGETGCIRYCFDSKKAPDFDCKRKLELIEEITMVKNGDKLLLNMETWEVCEYDEGLL